MISSFNHYIQTKKVKRKTPDPEEAKALLQQAQERLTYAASKTFNDKTAKFVLEEAYEAMREAIQSLMSAKGFKPYSHEATISFLKEFYNDIFSEEESNKLDYFRNLRNDSVYKAAPITKEEAKAILSFAPPFIKKIIKIGKKQP